jgi:hypothetical protein
VQSVLDGLANAVLHAGSEDRALALRSSIEIFRNSAVPAWYRVQFGIIAAIEAANLNPDGLDWSLRLSAEVIGLLERLTDRGASQQAAEHALVAFDGAIRRIASHVFINALAPSAVARVEETARRIDMLEELVERAAQSVGGPNIDMTSVITEAIESLAPRWSRCTSAAGGCCSPGGLNPAPISSRSESRTLSSPSASRS